MAAVAAGGWLAGVLIYSFSRLLLWALSPSRRGA